MVGIEADGGQHYENEGRVRDEFRTRELNRLGIEVMRFSDIEILANIDGVYEVIQRAIEKKRQPPHLSPLPGGERKSL